MANDIPTKADPEPWPGFSTPGWDSIDEAGWESFPASDPPAVNAEFELEPPVSLGVESEHLTTVMLTVNDTGRNTQEALDDE